MKTMCSSTDHLCLDQVLEPHLGEVSVERCHNKANKAMELAIWLMRTGVTTMLEADQSEISETTAYRGA